MNGEVLKKYGYYHILEIRFDFHVDFQYECCGCKNDLKTIEILFI